VGDRGEEKKKRNSCKYRETGGADKNMSRGEGDIFRGEEEDRS
jgi:hypothetical protein